MYGSTFAAIISAPRGKLKDKKGNSTRLIEFKIKVDFSTSIGGSLDKAAKAALAGLQDRGLSKIEVPIDSEAANITLTNGSDTCQIVGARGIKVVGKVNMNKPEDAPVAELHWRFNYEEAMWKFLGRNFGSTCDVLIEKQQLSLLEGGGEGEASKTGKGKKGSKAGAAAATS